MPAVTTGLYYALPPRLQNLPAILFLPQVLAYLGLAIWVSQNTAIPKRLGLRLPQLGQGVRWGLGVGLILGVLNVSVILWLVPLMDGRLASPAYALPCSGVVTPGFVGAMMPSAAVPTPPGAPREMAVPAFE